MKIVAFGELLWDLFPDGAKIGGAPLNLVFRVNTLGDQGLLISRIGQDEQGADALKMLNKLKISDELIQIDPVFPTGIATVRVGSEGRPDYIIEPDQAFDHIGISPEILKLMAEADCICFGTLVQRAEISRNTLREIVTAAPSALKYLDLKPRKNCFTKQVIEDSLRMANILRVKESELYLLKNELSLFEYESNSLAQELINEYSLDVILVTRSKAGAFALDKEGAYYEDQGYVIDLVDTVGSGAAFSAAFLNVYLSEKDLYAALRFGNAAGALTAETHGGAIAISRKQITELMRVGERRN